MYRRLKQKESQVNKLTKEVKDVEDQEQRKAFRIDMPFDRCTFSIIKIGNKMLKKGSNERPGSISDLSVNGMQLITDMDFPVRKHVVLRMTFKIKGEEFKVVGVIKRKLELNLKPKMTYGIEFKKLKRTTKERLFQLLNEIEIERKKKTE
ncbi:PilZ domain-containing protein [Salipaludibacillus sp. CF4.18]|uniref:PilZ domain-containing protein n=1 Tax=Salipaludibacillus sp. CF4.18 TaxID=3373081 RepID=UPI003EE67109